MSRNMPWVLPWWPHPTGNSPLVGWAQPKFFSSCLSELEGAMEAVTKEELCETLGISPRQADRLESEKVLTRLPDGGYDLKVNARSFCDYRRRDEPTKQARRDLLVAQTAERRLKIGSRLKHMVTDDELNEFVTQTWLEFLNAWRSV